ncbi:hypothetical protein B7P43_G17385 [Cryptotermes secundus]|uniref:Multidrug resistance-associated protein lethal(2)03659 n=1 Tax=Cryptotermes secundus TaxID=105785 RepID=A0A2J7QE13_9NEOP|nr:hypothetical protein B7P43_G17385 [Cryptotermes secundus]
MDAGLKTREIPHPRASANPLSAITFYWLMGTFKKGFKKDLELEDLYSTLEEHRSDYLGNKVERLWDQELERSNARNGKPSLFRVLRRCFGLRVILFGLVLAVEELLFKITQPLFVGGLIRYFSPESSVSRSTAFMYAAAIVICSAANVIVRQSFMLAMFHLGMKIRVSLCSLLYRKALRLSKTALRETTVGQAVNLMSNDVNRFDYSANFFVYLWVGPLQTLVISYLMWREIGFAAVIGVATIMLVIPLQAFFGKMLSTFRLRTAKRTDERVRFMNEIIVGMQVIKMYAWEKPFAHLVSMARRHEIQSIRAALYVRGLLLSFGRFSTKIAIFIAIVSYALLGNTVTAEKMFVITGFMNIINKAMTDQFPRSIAHLSEGAVSVKRIQKFLLYDEVTTASSCTAKGMMTTFTVGGKHRPLETGTEMQVAKSSEVEMNTCTPEDHTNVNDIVDVKGIKIANVTARWSEDLPENTLTDVSLDVRPGELVAVVGPVGSGKTSLLHAILKELPLNSGSISVGGSVSYASQEPWLFTGSVRQNILFGQPMDRNRYRQVVRVCALERDFQLLPHGDRTIVGERGVTLSGGQRARISLARAVYKQAEIYLLDDPLSAVDAHVGRHLFNDCICDFLQGKTRLLVTHQLQYLQAADNIVILNNGMVEATGAYNELHVSGLSFAKQLDLEVNTKDSEHHSLRHSDSELSLRKTKHQNSQTSEHSSVEESEPKQIAEMRTRGRVRSGVYRAYCAAGGNCLITFIVLSVFILAQLAVSVGDYWMSFWTNVEERRSLVSNRIASSIDGAAINDTTTQLTEMDVTTTDTSEWKLGVSTTIAPTDVTEWSWMPSTETCILVYVGLVIGIVVLTLASAFFFFSMCMRASINLHNSMFSSISRATMWFFNNNPSGQILNRFTKDMGAIDETLPGTMMDCVQRTLMMLGVIVVVAVVNYWMLIPTVVMLVVFYILRIYYVATSRSIKRLEGITRSPVFSHLSASLQGLTTIRIFGAQGLLEKEFDRLQDVHSTSHYLFLAANRAFGLWLDSICVVYIALVTFGFLVLSGVQYGGDVGLAITQATGLTGMLQWGIRQMAEMENQMTSVERVLEYTAVESEPPLDSAPDKKPAKDWPAKGTVVFDRVFLSYSKNESPVLRNVTFSIKTAEKVREQYDMVNPFGSGL